MKNNIEISHEVPICLLEKSRNFNTYDYALCHLLDQNEEYKNFFLESKRLGRKVYLDNGVHELLEPYKDDRLFYWLDNLSPNEFFVPDHWEDYKKSIDSARNWIKFQEEYPNTTFIAVVQGKSLLDAINCYQTYKELGYKKIAFSYGASYYNELVPHPNKDLGKALGRIQVISKLCEMKIIGNKDRIHLLGCSVPQEFGWYKDMSFIESIDTSNPVMAALDGVKYSSSGLYNKPKSCMNDNLYIEKRDIDLDILEYNTMKFRLINGL